MKEKEKIQMSQPNIIKAYNEEMEGMEMMDGLLEYYHPGTTMKKWWFFLFVNILNVSLALTCSPFHLQCSNPDSKTTHFEIPNCITLVLIKSEDETRVNQEKTMARELPVVIKTDKSHNESAPAR